MFGGWITMGRRRLTFDNIKELELIYFVKQYLEGDLYWKTESGKEIDFKDMDMNHLENIIKMSLTGKRKIKPGEISLSKYLH